VKALENEPIMTALEALQSVQFVSVNGQRLAVLDAGNWECLIEWLETLEDVQAAKEALRTLKAASSDLKTAGGLPWNEIREEF
jgi:hypothetical protein